MTEEYSQDMLRITADTIRHYEDRPEAFWDGTKDHDVSQNTGHFLDAIPGDPPYTLLDFGCGPGRDVYFFSSQGHLTHGLDGCEAFCKTAVQYTGCKILHQDFVRLDLEANFYDGIFANASLFHVPRRELPRVVHELARALKPNGVLFSSNPRGSGEYIDGLRYCNYMELEEYKQLVEGQGFELIKHYYRPDGRPREQQPWLACVFRCK